MKWRKIVRRVGAMCLAGAAAVSLLSVAVHAKPVQILLPPGTASGGPGTGGTSFWDRLLMRQSPFLSAGWVLKGCGTDQDSADPPAKAAPPTTAEELQLSAFDDEDPEEIPDTPKAEVEIIAQTLSPVKNKTFTADGVYLYNRTSKTPDMETWASADVTLSGTGKGPSILIVHTHATEAYTQEGRDTYQESDPYRTVDDAHNVVRVGDEMASAFAQAGLNVLHDRTLHDYPSYSGAYARSRETVEQYLAAYPSISIVLDVHRDALSGDNGTIYKVVADKDILPDTAQVMLVVGTEEGGGSHPNWEQNAVLAVTLEKALNACYPTLARPIVLRKSHYNQQLSPGSLLVEVGTHGNSLEEALSAARAFAQATAPIIKELIS